MKRRLVGLLCGFIACLGWHMAQAGAQELEINLPVEFETLQIIMTDEQQTCGPASYIGRRNALF